MGLPGNRRPPLPAPTESLSNFDDGPGRESSISPPRSPLIAPSDLATNLTTATNKTSYSIPDDGTPVTITTHTKTRDKSGLKEKLKGGNNNNSSQTSLLIEYFEAGKDSEGGSRRPSVRVRVTPSKKAREAGEGGSAGKGSVRITERNHRKPSYTRRISLGKGEEGVGPVEESNISSLEGSNLSGERPPVEVEVMQREGNSDLSRIERMDPVEVVSRFAPVNMSEVSSMPPDSMLEGGAVEPPVKPLTRQRSRSLERLDKGDKETLKPWVERSRSLSRERMVARKAVEKFEREARERRHKEKGEHRVRSGKSKSRSASKEHLSSEKPTKRKSSKTYDKEEVISSADPSLLAGSGVSGHSTVSGQSTASSIKNPKLLQTVEDAIRRLILPEINALKNEQKTSHRRSDRYDDDLSSQASSARNEEFTRGTRRRSGEKGPKLKLNGDIIKSSKGSRRSGGKELVDSPEREFERGMSEETVVRDGGPGRQKSKDKVKDLAAGAALGGLTYAALKAKDSGSSLERRERRKKRSKEHNRSTSRANSVEEIFSKHDVPPMPLASGLTDSDLTRDSILSERTSTPTQERNRDVRHLVRDSQDLPPGDPVTSTRHRSPPGERAYDVPKGNDVVDSVHLKKESIQDFEEHEEMYNDSLPAEPYAQDQPYIPMYDPAYSSPNYNGLQRRGLSPIQSVASFEERGEDAPHRRSLHQTYSTGSLTSTGRELQGEQSFDSLSSGTASKIKRKSLRPKPVTLETAQEVLHGQGSPVGNVLSDSAGQEVRGVGANPEYIDTRHGVESAVASLMDPSTVGERSNLSYGSNELSTPNRYSIGTDPHREFYLSQERNLHTPDRSSPLKHEVHPHELNERVMAPNYRYEDRAQSLTPSKERGGISTGSSPFVEKVDLSHSALPTTGSPMPEVGHMEDDVITNPSEFRNSKNLDPWTESVPIREQRSGTNSARDSLASAAKNMLAAATAAGAEAALAQGHKGSQNDPAYASPPQTASPGVSEPSRSPAMVKSPQKQADFSPYQPDYTPLQPFGKDEGYMSGMQHPPTEPPLTPDYRMNGGGGILGAMDMGGDEADDPFTISPKRARPMTGDSDAMPDPLFDASTGRGMDRIKNTDIVALMDHLHVRDAQRNARDTEILVTLVRSAAEMRNSFDEMKHLIEVKNKENMDHSVREHNETRRVIGGPRPMTSKMSSKASEAMTDDIPAKRRNVFRRALKGLGGGNKQDLSKLEDMLMQLLDEVADIKAAQAQPQSIAYQPPLRTSGLTSYELLRDGPPGPPESYQPRNSTGTREDSGYSSANSSLRPGQNNNRRGSEPFGKRVSTVHEDDEEDLDNDTPLDEREQNILGDERADHMLTPSREFRGVAVSGGAPQGMNSPSQHKQQQQAQSAEPTPTNRKHRSTGSSSFFPKISRWSKTTTSTIPGLDPQTPTQSTNNRRRPVSEMSRSASDLAGEDAGYDVNAHYDPHGDDRIRSKTSLSQHSAATGSTAANARPPSPLIPSRVSASELKPTYSAHRDSLNLQHPQPRQGPTARFQNHLESEAARDGFARGQGGEGPDSPTSDVLGSNPVLSRFGGREAGNRYSGISASAGTAGGELSPIGEAGGKVHGQGQGPPRPPKVKDEGPLVPPKVPVEEQRDVGNANAAKIVSFADRMASNNMPQRKPTGPRPITGGTSGGTYSPKGPGNWKQTAYRMSPNHIPSDDESETF